MTRRSRNKPKGEKNSQSASSRISQAVGNGIGRLTGKAKLSPPASEEEEEEKVPLSKQPSDGGKDKVRCYSTHQRLHDLPLGFHWSNGTSSY